jgi:hypothetical protein
LKKPETSVEVEIRTYFKEDTKPKGTNVLAYWAGCQKKFPILSKMAQTFLAIPATSAASEQVFSKGRQIISWQRSSLLSNSFCASRSGIRARIYRASIDLCSFLNSFACSEKKNASFFLHTHV